MAYMEDTTCSALVDYEGVSCQPPYKGGVDRVALICQFTSEEIATLVKSADPTRISDITMNVDKRMYKLKMKSNSGLAEIESAASDAGILTDTDTFSFEGEYQEAADFDYFKDLMVQDREWLVLVPMADENASGETRYMCFGHSGGLHGLNVKWTSGKSGEFTGFTVSFTNTTKATGLWLVADPVTYTGGNAELIADLLTVVEEEV